MRRILILLAVVLLLVGCTAQEPEPAYITVSLGLPEGCYVLENGLKLESGEDAYFELVVKDGYEFAGLDYDGSYLVEEVDGLVYICLEEVRYPTLATVSLTQNFCTINYEPNGAQGSAISLSYDLSEHLRPNTSIGTNLFERDGYTMTGWNTETDGSGVAVGLGSRVTVTGGKLTLYAQWAQWSPAADFLWESTEDGVRITAYVGKDDTVVVPGQLGGQPVTAIGGAAFLNCEASHVILPLEMKILEAGAFTRCAMKELTFFDTIEQIADDRFVECSQFSTLHINAVEAPWGYNYRRESCLADKVDLLILAQGQQKAVFYGGCSMWYNLDGSLAQEMLGDEYRVINLGLNGVMNSSAQMQIFTAFLEEGDLVFHTPEISSAPQMMQRTQMINHDRKLWCGLEYNYDLVSLVDVRKHGDFFDILYYWLSTKEQTSSYIDVYRDSKGNRYVDAYGCASFYRDVTASKLEDSVNLNSTNFDPTALAVLEEHYQAIMAMGAKIYVGHACVNMEAVPDEQRDSVEETDALFRAYFEAMDGITVVGSMSDYLYENNDFYDTNYHLLTAQASENTYRWMLDLTAQMILDGLLKTE